MVRNSIVTLVLTLSTLLTQPAVAAGPQGDYIPAARLEIGPIPQITVGWHPAPKELSVPSGRTLRFRQQAPADAQVSWTGAMEVSRDDLGSIAECPLELAGPIEVETEVIFSDGRTARRTARVNVTSDDVESIVVDSISVRALDPFIVDEDASNVTTVWAYKHYPSIAEVRRGPLDDWITSVGRDLLLQAVVSPDVYGEIVEWRLDGRPLGLGAEAPYEARLWQGDRPAVREIAAGPLPSAATTTLTTYEATITTRDWKPDPGGVTKTFEAVTEPAGYEEYITWMSSTSFGTAEPTLGRGGTFVTAFDDVWGLPYPDATELGYWVGVRADNTGFADDQGGGCDIESVEVEPCSLCVSKTKSFEVKLKPAGAKSLVKFSIENERDEDGNPTDPGDIAVMVDDQASKNDSAISIRGVAAGHFELVGKCADKEVFRDTLATGDTVEELRLVCKPFDAGPAGPFQEVRPKLGRHCYVLSTLCDGTKKTYSAFSISQRNLPGGGIDYGKLTPKNNGDSRTPPDTWYDQCLVPEIGTTLDEAEKSLQDEVDKGQAFGDYDPITNNSNKWIDDALEMSNVPRELPVDAPVSKAGATSGEYRKLVLQRLQSCGLDSKTANWVVNMAYLKMGLNPANPFMGPFLQGLGGAGITWPAGRGALPVIESGDIEGLEIVVETDRQRYLTTDSVEITVKLVNAGADPVTLPRIDPDNAAAYLMVTLIDVETGTELLSDFPGFWVNLPDDLAADDTVVLFPGEELSISVIDNYLGVGFPGFLGNEITGEFRRFLGEIELVVTYLVDEQNLPDGGDPQDVELGSESSSPVVFSMALP